MDAGLMSEFDLAGTLRRIRRLADVSQRDLAKRLSVSKSSIAAAESGVAGLDARLLARAAAVAGLRLALLDGDGDEVAAMAATSVRDLGGRRFPAHLDTCHSDDRWWRYEHRYDRPRPWYTVDRDRAARDALRRSAGMPEDHHAPGPVDSPQERKVRRRQEARRLAAEEWQRQMTEGPLPTWVDVVCSCPDRCDQVDIGERPQHASECGCLCDLD